MVEYAGRKGGRNIDSKLIKNFKLFKRKEVLLKNEIC